MSINGLWFETHETKNSQFEEQVNEIVALVRGLIRSEMSPFFRQEAINEGSSMERTNCIINNNEYPAGGFLDLLHRSKALIGAIAMNADIATDANRSEGVIFTAIGRMKSILLEFNDLKIDIEERLLGLPQGEPFNLDFDQFDRELGRLREISRGFIWCSQVVRQVPLKNPQLENPQLLAA
jgi:hypothetical protein